MQRLGRRDETIQNAYAAWLVESLKYVFQKAPVVRLTLDDSETFRENLTLYGGVKRVEFKTTLATSRIADGRPVRLVASRFMKGDKAGDWAVFVSTNLTATPQEILSEYSRRFSIEEMFKDLKEVCGLGRQEVRKWESCKACATITSLNFTAIEI